MSRFKRKKLKEESHHKTTKKSRKTLYWTLTLVGLMILSGFGIILGGYDDGMEKKPYNGEDFKLGPDGWLYEREGVKYVFSYYPGDLEGLEIPSAASKLLGGATFVYVTFSPDTKDIQTVEEARFKMINFMTTNEQYPMPGVGKEDDQYSLPIIDCQNATEMMPVLYIELANTTSVEKQGSCVIAKSTPYELNALIDRISYGMLGVMQ